MRLAAIGLALLVSTAAQAEGFVVDDLTGVAGDLRAALGSGFTQKAEPKRVTLACTNCADKPVVDVQLGRQTDGTEQRVRSGQTTIASLEKQCQSKSPSCTISRLDVSPAVGWISTYSTGATAGSTAVMLRDGDMLVVRSIASDAAVARRNAEKVVAAARKVIGN